MNVLLWLTIVFYLQVMQCIFRSLSTLFPIEGSNDNVERWLLAISLKANIYLVWNPHTKIYKERKKMPRCTSFESHFTHKGTDDYKIVRPRSLMYLSAILSVIQVRSRSFQFSLKAFTWRTSLPDMTYACNADYSI